jgi:hypothetical protein
MPWWAYLVTGWFIGATLVVLWVHGCVAAERRRERRRLEALPLPVLAEELRVRRAAVRAAALRDLRA